MPGTPENSFRSGIICRCEVPVKVVATDGSEENKNIKVVIYIPDMEERVGLPNHQHCAERYINGSKNKCPEHNYNGMFPCFFRGNVTTLFSSIAKPLINLMRI